MFICSFNLKAEISLNYSINAPVMLCFLTGSYCVTVKASHFRQAGLSASSVAMEQTSDFSSAVAFFFCQKRITWGVLQSQWNLAQGEEGGSSPTPDWQGTSLAMGCEGVSHVVPATWPILRRRGGKQRMLLLSEIKFERLQQRGLLEISENTVSYLQMIL